MKPVPMHKKRLGQLKLNVINLPSGISLWKLQGKTEQAKRAAEILDQSIAEIERRAKLAVSP